MAKLSKNEILQMENPFRALGDGNALSKHAEELKQLDPNEMNVLARRLVINCPNDKLREYGRNVEALANENPQFYAMLACAMDIKQRFYSLLDPGNPNPSHFFTNEEFSTDLYNSFHGLFDTLAENHQTEIAIRLAQTTPAEIANTLVRNLGKISASELSGIIGTAFQLRHELTTHLLGEKPENFFSSPEYNVDSCLKFLPLIEHFIKGKEAAVGHLLGQASERELPTIADKLRILGESLAPFKRIAQAFNETAEPRFQIQKERARHARAAFGSFPRAPGDSDSDDSSQNNSSIEPLQMDSSIDRPQCCNII